MGKALLLALAALAAQTACADEPDALKDIILRRFDDLIHGPTTLRTDAFAPYADDILAAYAKRAPFPNERGNVAMWFGLRDLFHAASPAARKAVCEAVVEAARQGEDAKARSLLAMVEDYPTPVAPDLVRTLAKDPNPKARAFGLQYLWIRNKDDLAMICAGPPELIRTKASYAPTLEQVLADPAAVPIVASLVSFPDRQVALAAITTLRKAPSAGPTLEALLPKLKGEMAAQALQSLVEADPDRARAHVLASVDSKDDELRWRALQLCAKFEGHDFLQTVAKWLRAPDPYDRVAALNSVSILTERERQDAGWAALHDRSPDVRIAAIRVFTAAEKSVDLRSWLVPMLGDSDLSVRGEAAYALASAYPTPHMFPADRSRPDENAVVDTYLRMVDWRRLQSCVCSSNWYTRYCAADFVALWFPQRAGEIPLGIWHKNMNLAPLCMSNEPLVRALIDSHSLKEIKRAPFEFRVAAASSLMARPSPDRRDLVAALSLDPEPSVHCRFGRWLASPGIDNGIGTPPYMEVFNKLPAQSRIAIVANCDAGMLVVEDREKVEKTLRALLGDPDWQVRHIAAGYLKTLYWTTDYLAEKRRLAEQPPAGDEQQGIGAEPPHSP